MVYYRKYRPQTIAELDNPKLRETLTSVLSAKDIPHSFLFTGPKGLGKTSTARIIAKSLNCTNRKGVEPCNVCEQCTSITNGSNIDVLEIDGASNRGIDEIRELRERVNLAPSTAKMKVYIIDEVHMLTTEAFNALLKTIEEPPAHVVFIFCTTEPQKIPATIISRCFHISLNRASDEELIHSLKRIVKEEKIDIDEDALLLIAHLGDGGFRDTQKLFEEVVALANGAKITKALAEEKLKVSGISYLISGLVEGLGARDVKKSLQIVSQVVEKGLDSKYFVQELLSALHELMLGNAGIIQDTRYNMQNTNFSTAELTTLIGLLQQAYLDTKYAVIPQLPLELVCVGWCSGKEPKASNGTEESKGEAVSYPVHVSSKPTVSDLLKKEKNLKVQAIIHGPNGTKETKETKGNDDVSHKQENLPENASGSGVLLENIIYKVKPYNHSVAGVLRGCSIKLVDGEKIIFETPYKFHKEKLDEFKTKEILEKGVREITGKNLSVMVELKK